MSESSRNIPVPGRGSSGGSPVGRLRAVAVRIVIRTRAVAAARRKLIPPGMQLQAKADHSASNLEVYTTAVIALVRRWPGLFMKEIAVGPFKGVSHRVHRALNPHPGARLSSTECAEKISENPRCSLCFGSVT